MSARPVPVALFRKFSELIRRRAGINLADSKRALLTGRLARRLRELGDLPLGEYLERVVGDDAEMTLMLDLVSTNETHFFREGKQWDLLEREVFPGWQADAEQGLRPRRVRAWSAACSSGEEPFTLAMLLHRRFTPERGWHCEIEASDLSTRILERARLATWPMRRAAEIPKSFLHDYFLRGTGPEEGNFRAGPELRSLIHFSRVNLMEEAQYPDGPFDLIFCRNVLIYFDAPTKQAVVRRLLRRLAPGGLLLLGHAESLIGMNEGMLPLGPSVYAAAPRRSPVRASGMALGSLL
jgi:chemotaxis protein methyltransferase CheR